MSSSEGSVGLLIRCAVLMTLWSALLSASPPRQDAVGEHALRRAAAEGQQRATARTGRLSAVS